MRVYRQTLETALQNALSYLDSLETRPVAARADLAALRAQIAKSLENEGLPADQVVAELARDVEGGLIGSAGGRFFGWVIGGTLPAALGADWLASLVHDADARRMDWNPEWSRRVRGFATYAALRQLGRDGVAELVKRCCEHAHALVMGIGALPGAEVVWEPVINQGLVRFLDLRPGASQEDHDRRTNEVIAEIVASGEAFFGGTTWRGRRAMRVSVSGWQTTGADVRRVIDAVAKVLKLTGAHAE